MADEKPVLEKAGDELKAFGKKAEEVLDEMSADEKPLTVTYPDSEKSPPPAKK